MEIISHLCQYTVPCFLMFLPTIHLLTVCAVDSKALHLRMRVLGSVPLELVLSGWHVSWSVYQCSSWGLTLLSLFDIHFIPTILQLVSPSSPLPALSSFSPRHQGSQKEGSEDAYTLLQVPWPMITPGVGLRFLSTSFETVYSACCSSVYTRLAGREPSMGPHVSPLGLQIFNDSGASTTGLWVIWQALHTLRHLLCPEMRF